ncbi:hypothetical protein ACFQ3S_14295 [Mucilaginibacter terrae]|uniref:hypothetical protein n=1 Tax=Mucilaginibacter terrae TaxID=1955052 RepID=UPI00362D7043
MAKFLSKDIKYEIFMGDPNNKSTTFGGWSTSNFSYKALRDNIQSNFSAVTPYSSIAPGAAIAIDDH